MGQIYNPQRPGKERDHLIKMILYAIDAMETTSIESMEYKDLSTFIFLSAKSVLQTIERTAVAWEKRDYWLKADRFRQEWNWLETGIPELEKTIMNEEWNSVQLIVAGFRDELELVDLPKRKKSGEPWAGAYLKMLDIKSL